MGNFNDLIKNFARGGVGYYHARHRLALEMLTSANVSCTSLNDFLAQKFFNIDAPKWKILNFDRKDWRILERLQNTNSIELSENYLHLVVSYILQNVAAVKRLYVISQSISSAVLQDDTDEITKAVESLDPFGQSLFAFRVACARRSHSSTDLMDYLKHEMKSGWLQKRFIYPLVFYSVNAPPDAGLDAFLPYVVNRDLQTDVELRTIKFLLRDEVAYGENFPFKAYIALLCHPFDACEMLLNHFEMQHVSGKRLREFELEQLHRLNEAVQCVRASNVLDFINRKEWDFETVPASLVPGHFDLIPQVQDFFCRFLDVSKDTDFADGSKFPVLNSLARMRRERFPTFEDFSLLVKNAASWRFTDAFRLVEALLTSIYMVSRRERASEWRDACRLIGFFGAATPFILAGPAGDQLLDNGIVIVKGGKDRAESIVTNAVKLSNQYSGRLWIKGFHWHLRDIVKTFNIPEWLKSVRASVRVAPAFLSGIDWSWVEGVIKKLRVAPFRGRPDGAYALLLSAIENKTKDLTTLRAAIEPMAAGKSLSGFVEWLNQEYGAESVAFVRYFLTPENILMLQFAPNYTAALTGRIMALSDCIKKFGFGILLTEQQFLVEWNSLTTSLLLMNVGRGQFDIPWEMFKKDAKEDGTEAYEAYNSLRSGPGFSILGKSRIRTPYKFRNGNVVTYDLQNDQWPLAMVILSVIETFMEHPSFGIEALLSTRFRHDTLRREFARSIELSRTSLIPGVPRSAQNEIIDRLTPAIYSEIDAWLIKHMQTIRPEKQDAFFDFAPSQVELLGLGSKLVSATTHEEIIETVRDWIIDKLKRQVDIARDGFLDQLGPALIQVGLQMRDEILLTEKFRTTDVQYVAAALASVVAHDIHNLSDWFTYTSGETTSFTFDEVRIATEGLFEDRLKKGDLITTAPRQPEALHQIENDKVRLSFDLMSEILNNALKFKSGKCARLRVAYYRVAPVAGWVFSSYRCVDNAPFEEFYTGERYQSDNDRIFGEGHSGLAKVAALSATLVGRSVQVRVVRKKSSFHVFVPFWTDAA